MFDSNADVLVDRAVYILKVNSRLEACMHATGTISCLQQAAPSDHFRVGAGWYGEALVSRPFVVG